MKQMKLDVINFVKDLSDSVCEVEIKTDIPSNNAVLSDCKVSYDEKNDCIIVDCDGKQIKFDELNNISEMMMGYADKNNTLKYVMIDFSLELRVGIVARTDGTPPNIRKTPFEIAEQIDCENIRVKGHPYKKIIFSCRSAYDDVFKNN